MYKCLLIENMLPQRYLNILGIYIYRLEYMLLPRLAALSEVCWLKHSDKDLERLKASLVYQHFKMYKILGYNFRSAIDF